MAGPRRSGPFPGGSLLDVEGAPHELAEAWRDGGALILIGHRNCKTTRQTLPYVDRIHRRRAGPQGVVAVLQDDAATARELRQSLKLALPLRLEPNPYPIARELALVTVPTLYLVDARGEIEHVSEAFHRAELEELAARLGVAPPLFTPEDKAPVMKPG
jgi:hypothetical protein